MYFIYLFNDHSNHSGPASIRQLFAISIIVYRQINIVPANDTSQIICLIYKTKSLVYVKL